MSNRKRLGAIAVAAALLAGCVESDPTATATVNLSHDGGQAVDAAFVDAAIEAVDAADAQPEGWSVGVLYALGDGDMWEASFITGDGGVEYVRESWGCDGPYSAQDALWLLYDVGDLVTFFPGDDTKVCVYEIRLLRKAAVSAKGEP